jgi:hypothetical protein
MVSLERFELPAIAPENMPDDEATTYKEAKNLLSI